MFSLFLSFFFYFRRAVEVKETAEKKKLQSGESVAADKKKVTLAHVASVCSEVYGSRLSSSSSSNSASFPLQQKLVICSLMVCLRDKKIKEVTTGKVCLFIKLSDYLLITLLVC